MRRSVQKIIDDMNIDKGNSSPELESKIQEFKNFEKDFRNGKGDVIYGIQRMDEYENEINEIARNLIKKVEK